MELYKIKKDEYKEYRDEINSLIMAEASEYAAMRLEKDNPNVEVIEIDPDDDGTSTHYKEEFQSLANSYYDDEYDRIAKLIGFDYAEEDGILKPSA